MIQLVILYIIILGGFVIFLTTRDILRNLSDGDVTRRERYLHSLNFLGFIIPVSYTPFFLFLEMASSVIGRYDEFLNDVFSTQPIIMNIISMTMFLIVGYIMDSRESYAPVNAVTSRWLLFIIILISLAGILGLFTGVFL